MGKVTPESIVKNCKSESAQQIALFCWASQHPELKWMHKIRNEDDRGAKLGAKNKAEGIKAGVADVFLPKARHGWHGLYIELKVGDNKQSAPQKDFASAITVDGYAYVLCYSWDEAAKTICNYMGLKWDR